MILLSPFSQGMLFGMFFISIAYGIAIYFYYKCHKEDILTPVSINDIAEELALLRKTKGDLYNPSEEELARGILTRKNKQRISCGVRVTERRNEPK